MASPPSKILKLDDELKVSKNSSISTIIDENNIAELKNTNISEVEQSSFAENNVAAKNSTISGEQHSKNLATFKFEKVLSNNTLRKSICLKGNFADVEGDAIVILSQATFGEKLFKETSYFSEGNTKITFENDSYGNFTFFPKPEFNGIDVTIIHPATEKHIKKYSSHNLYMLNETPEVYNEIVLPLLKDQFSLQWIQNILDHKAETERIVFEDPDPEIGFVLLPDLKWGGQVNSLYLLAICRKSSIKSLRDLKSEHLPLLKNIYNKGIEAIFNKYGLNRSQLRIYLHYQPSFYHLHVHFTYLRHEAPGILVERAHLLSSVIDNIELMPEYYQKATISYIVKENDLLFEKLEEKKILEKIPLIE
ncbi:m7GpppX diphosphatase [Coccinella septempunctata]|uniref:m7GpppX diphosphatase n=1 Tax=Coccinella septempunctata TaxID=41139 RepID=UPI001D07808D|nr:m7GpppX diphosphatase [Coccinella septempunctata]